MPCEKRDGTTTLYMRKDGLMFGYFETPESFKAASVAVDKYEASMKWHEFMRPFFEAMATGPGGEQILEIELEEVVHLD